MVEISEATDEDSKAWVILHMVESMEEVLKEVPVTVSAETRSAIWQPGHYDLYLRNGTWRGYKEQQIHYLVIPWLTANGCHYLGGRINDGTRVR